MRVLVGSALLVSLIASAPAHTAPCSGFDDVDATEAFCPSVEWMRNRGITQGCSATQYCPSASVLRIQMAAFMSRLGAALTPTELLVQSMPGNVDLDTGIVLCQTPGYTVTGYPRRADVDLVFAARTPGTVAFGADLVATFDGGTTWGRLTLHPSRASLAPSVWGTQANFALLDLEVGQTVRFGVQMNRADNGTTDLTETQCNLRVSIRSRTGAASPY